MVDISKHLARARQAMDKRNYDMAIEVCEQCQEVAPTDVELYRVMIDAAKRRAKESPKGGLFGGMSMPAFSKDPHKLLTAQMKRVAKTPDSKTLAAAGDAALKVYQTGLKAMLPVATFLYEEQKATGLFNADVLWNLANCYCDRFKEARDADALERAIRTMAELERAMPTHPEAGRTIKNWEAMRSMGARTGKAQGAPGTADYRSQLASTDQAARSEAMNRQIRTVEDAQQVLGYIEQDLKAKPDDKHLWLKKGDIHRRFEQWDLAREAFQQAQRVDQYDFVVTMRLGELNIEEMRAKVKAAEAAGIDISAMKQQLVQTEIAEYRQRVERQPTDMSHRYGLAMKLIQAGDVSAAAGELQRTVADPKLRKPSHRYLGYCLTKKGIFDLAVKQYSAYLELCEEDLGDEAKEVRYERGRIYERTGKVGEAVADYSRLVEIDLGFRDAADRLARLRQEGDSEATGT